LFGKVHAHGKTKLRVKRLKIMSKESIARLRAKYETSAYSDYRTLELTLKVNVRFRKFEKKQLTEKNDTRENRSFS